MAAEIHDFDPKRHVANRKQLKVMCRDAQLGVAAAAMACEDAGIAIGAIDPDRFGVVLGADRICTAMPDCEPSYRVSIVDGRFDFRRFVIDGFAATFPLNFLKVLPNMIASHVSIAHDARGPCNTIHQSEASGLLAVAEAAHIIRRGTADVMLAGGASSQLNPFDCIRHCVMGNISRRQEDPAMAMRPFDADRDGQVWGEGAAAFILERREHAESRGATILARLLATASACDAPVSRNGSCSATTASPRRTGDGLRRAMRMAIDAAQGDVKKLGHINAHGLSTLVDDQIESKAIDDVTPNVPVTAPKSYFGNLGAAGGAMEMAVSTLAMHTGIVPPSLNYCRPDPACPVRMIRGEPLAGANRAALVVNRTSAGQAVAVVLGGA